MSVKPAEIEVSKSELRALQVAMIDSSNDAIVTTDLDQTVTGWDAAAEFMYGYSAEEMIGKSASLLMEPHRADELATIFQHIRSGKPVERYETVRLAKDGHRVTISLTMVPILDSKGHVVGATSLARDITELKLAEETAEGAVRYALGLIEAAPDAVVIVGPDGFIAFANTQTERQFGYTKKEIIGKQVEMLMPERFHSQHGDHRRRYAFKPEVRPMGLGLALFGRRKDGSEFPVDVTLSPVQIEPGVPGVFAAVRDVTVQRQHAEAEIALRLAKEMERLTELERFQRLTVGRELKMIELKREIEDLKLKIEKLGGATTDSESWAVMEAEAPGQECNAQIGGSDYERAPINLLDNSTIDRKYLGETGRAMLNILYDYDVEKREAERANHALVQSECLAAIGEMASMVSHELRGSLAVITNVQYLIHQGVGTESLATLEVYFDTIDREIDKAKRIAEDLLGYGKMRAPELQTLNLEQVCAELMEVAPPPDGVEVYVDAGGTVVADRIQLGEVLVNLVTNAYDAMPDGGVVSIKAEYDIANVLLLIDDTGTGIDPRIADTLFNPFVSTKQRGTGLGLSIVRRIADAHSGSITVGPAPGGGTRFMVRFPRSTPKEDVPTGVDFQIKPELVDAPP